MAVSSKDPLLVSCLLHFVETQENRMKAGMSLLPVMELAVLQQLVFLGLRTFVVKVTCASVLGSSGDSLWWRHRPVSCAPTGEVHMPSGKTATPEIVDNKDGTVTVRYAPTEVGLHEMHIKYMGSHIPGESGSAPLPPAPRDSRSQGGNTREVIVLRSVRCRVVLGGRFADTVWASLQNQAACDPSRSG